MKLCYFAWIKEEVGRAEENFDTSSINLSGLLEALCAKGAKYNDVFSKPERFCISINNRLVSSDIESYGALNNNDEIAFFPPVSGG